MKLRKPDYYDQFQCIAGACKDSCCIGWEIDVDEEKRELYRTTGGALGERLKRDIDWEEGHFILQGKEERCPFLNQENLCDLILGLGEESLCEICREHPRFYEWYDHMTEAGLGLCCEAAARLILERKEPAEFVLQMDSESEPEADDTEILFQARDTAFMILQNRAYSIWERLSVFLIYIEELQTGLDFENFEEIAETAEYYWDAWFEMEEMDETSYERLLKICRELEPIDEQWPRRLEALSEFIADTNVLKQTEEEMNALYSSHDYEYEHIAVYFVYRYFMKCRMDGDIYSKGILTVFFVLLVHLQDLNHYAKTGSLTTENRAMNAKDCSKEIEYSEENLETLANIFWEQSETAEVLKSLLLYKCREKVHNKEE